MKTAEVKLSGVDAIAITRRNFEVARAAGVKCSYVSFCDRRNAAATTEMLGFPCFNLTWYHGPNKPREDTGQWPMLVKFLREYPCVYGKQDKHPAACTCGDHRNRRIAFRAGEQVAIYLRLASLEDSAQFTMTRRRKYLSAPGGHTLLAGQ